MLDDVLISFAEMMVACLSFCGSLLALPFSLLPKKPRIAKSILITGASSGIGEALALKYARPGVFLALVGRKKDLMETVANGCRQLGAEVEIGLVDVTDAKGLEAFILRVDAAHPLDLVIANAGISGHMLGDKPWEEKVAKIFEVNVTGVFNTVNPILSKFKERKNGQIAVVGSVSGFFDFPRTTAYSASKGAVFNYCRGLRGLLKPYDVGVTVICPGYVETKFTQHTHSLKRATPFLMDTDRASGIIISGLQSDDSVIAFPLPMYVLTFVLRAVPPRVLDFCLRTFGFHSKVVPWNQVG